MLERDHIWKLANQSDVAVCTRECLRLAGDLGLSVSEQWRLAIAVSEITGAAVEIIGGCEVTLRPLESPRAGLEVVVDGTDGFACELSEERCQSLRERWTALRFFGAVRRMVNDILLESEPAGGTRLVLRHFVDGEAPE